MAIPSNFDFLKGAPVSLYDSARRAEGYALSDPRASAFYSRFTLEMALKWLAENDGRVAWRPYISREVPGDSLGTFIGKLHNAGITDFKQNQHLTRVLDAGNDAVHEELFEANRSKEAAVALHKALEWLARRRNWVQRAGAFVIDHLVEIPNHARLKRADMQALQAQLDLSRQEGSALRIDIARQGEELAATHIRLIEAKAKIAWLEDELGRLRSERAGSVPQAEVDALLTTLYTTEAAYREMLASAGMTATRYMVGKGVVEFKSLFALADDDERPGERDEAVALILERQARRYAALFIPLRSQDA